MQSSGEFLEDATNFWQKFTQIDMSEGAVVPLPQQPLSLLPYEESSFYVRSVYYRLRDIVKARTGACAADKQFDHMSSCNTAPHPCNAVQSCSFANFACHSHMCLIFCRPHPDYWNSRSWQNQHALVHLVESCQGRFCDCIGALQQAFWTLAHQGVSIELTSQL